jgi:hypothetical protein
VDRVSMSGHFLLRGFWTGGGGNKMDTFGSIHLDGVAQSLGRPISILLSPERYKCFLIFESLFCKHIDVGTYTGTVSFNIMGLAAHRYRKEF